jgi:hypothetical protein
MTTNTSPAAHHGSHRRIALGSALVTFLGLVAFSGLPSHGAAQHAPAPQAPIEIVAGVR